jgi:hypothetical protein
MIYQRLSIWKKRGKKNNYFSYLPVKFMMQQCLRRNFMETAFPYTSEAPLRAFYLTVKNWEQDTDIRFNGTKI